MTFGPLRSLLWAGALSSIGGSASAQTLPISFGQEQVVGRDAGIASLMMARVAPDGSVYVVDDVSARVVAFDADGRQRWTLGRRGRGPGEFQTPYRLDVRRDGTVFVYDAATGEVTSITPEGRFLERYRLPFAFSQANNLVALDDVLLISGTTTDPAGSGRAIHRFRLDGNDLRHDGSFGLLPVVRDPMVLQQWGAGSLVRGSTGSIWYTRRLPYEVYRFDVSGRQRALVRAPFRTRGTPDDAIRIERSTRSTTFVNTGAYVEIPGPAWELPGGLLLVSRIRPGERYWDVFSVSGRFRGSHRLPAAWESIAGYDAQRNVLWVTGMQDDIPVLYRVPVTLSPQPARRP
jgi:hypothetical protein